MTTLKKTGFETGKKFNHYLIKEKFASTMNIFMLFILYYVSLIQLTESQNVKNGGREAISYMIE